MAGKRETKREELKARLLNAATSLIESNGVKDLNARSVTTKAGCALGSLYTVFEDLDDLIFHVSSQTLQQLATVLQAELAGVTDPVEILKALARGYFTFAREHYSLWNALFDYSALSSDDIPGWHQEEQALLIQFIMGPVSELSPQLTDEEVALRARTLFAAVHGMVSFSVQGRFIGLAKDDLESELIRFIDQMVAGLHAPDQPKG